MPIDTQSYMDAIASHAAASGHFESVNSVDIGSTPSNQGIVAVLWPRRIRALPGASGLNSTSVAIEFNMRLMCSMNTDPFGQIDPRMIAAADALMNAYSGDFTLGGTIAYVDLLGQHGAPMESQSGFLTIGEDERFRIVDITIPCIINDVWNQAE